MTSQLLQERALRELRLIGIQLGKGYLMTGRGSIMIIKVLLLHQISLLTKLLNINDEYQKN